MRFLARLSPGATLEPSVTQPSNYYLTVGGKCGYVRFTNGMVWLQGKSLWEAHGYPLRKHRAGRLHAEAILQRITRDHDLVAPRIARFREADLGVAGLATRKSEHALATKELQRKFDDAMADRGLTSDCGVRFYVVEGGWEYGRPSPPTQASVLCNLKVTPESAGTLLDLLVVGGFLRPKGCP
jgi:hypothetical protein